MNTPMSMIKPGFIFSITFMFAMPFVVWATEKYDLAVTMPISEAGGKVELRQITFTTYYSPLETRVGAVTWDPCKAKDQTADCDLINPINASNLKVVLRAFNAGDIYDIDGCYVQLDLKEYKSLSNNLRAALDSQNPKAQLLRLALKSIERNTQESEYYMDCAYRIRGLEQHTDLAGFEVPAFLHPIIPMCQAYTRAGRQHAVALNDKGMDYYREKDWEQAAKLFRQAAEQDCTYFIALTNLASVLSLQKKYHLAQSVLWRAYKLDPERTMKKLETDPDYSKLKHYSNFYAAASAIGMSYRRYCYVPADPADVSPELPGLIDKSNINKWKKRYSVATRYTFKSDFNKNGIADWVYPLVNARLDGVLVVFDGDQLNTKACTSTPLQGSDAINANRGDPCKTKIFAGRQGPKMGIRLETDTFGVNRLVCDNN